MQATREIAFPDTRTAKMAARSVRPETRNTHEKRARATIENHKNIVSAKIVASDGRALEASKAAYTRLLETCREIAYKWR